METHGKTPAWCLWSLAATAAGVLACGEPPSASPPGPSTQERLCSQVHAAAARFAGRRGECGPDVSERIDLLPLGRGGLLLHYRVSGRDSRWDLGADGLWRESERAINGDAWPYAGFTLLPPYEARDSAEPVLFSYNPRIREWTLARVATGSLQPIKGGTWPVLNAPEPWNDERPGGREIVGLGEALLLDRNLSDGRIRMLRLLEESGTFTLTPAGKLESKARDSFRRGRHLVPLGPGRLLTWRPTSCAAPLEVAVAPGEASCAFFEIWPFDVTSTQASTKPSAMPSAKAVADEDGKAATDPFPEMPLFSGVWSDVGQGEQLLADEAHLIVWTRATGTLRTYQLDTSGRVGDPLAPELAMGPPQTIPALTAPALSVPTRSARLRQLVVILQDGRSFDSYFGHHCQGVASAGGAPPACEDGPACCEGVPESARDRCLPLEPDLPMSHRPNSSPICMRAKMNGGAMDAFAGTSLSGCGDPRDLVCAGAGPEAGPLAKYHALADEGALADRFFQTYAHVDKDGDPDGHGPAELVLDPAITNLTYLTAARFGDPASFWLTPQLEQELARVEVPWAIYAGPAAHDYLRTTFAPPSSQDPGFYPFRSLAGDELEKDIRDGQLPAVTVVLPDFDDPARGEGRGHALGAPISYVTGLVDQLTHSPRYREDTLVLLTYLTAGGHWDHVRPPPPPPLFVDATEKNPRAIHYGPRVPLLALGSLARPHHVSHVQLELSSITQLIEWNWLSGRTQRDVRAKNDPRSYRDGTVSGLGSLLDPALGVPEGPPVAP